MEKIATITSCCGIFFILHMDPKLPSAVIWNHSLLCESYAIMQDTTVQAVSKEFRDHNNWQLSKNSISYSPVGSLPAG